MFKYCRNLKIYGKRDSAAERYAYINGIEFVSGKYKVIFKNNGHTIHTYYIDEGGSVTPPTLDEKPGYTLSWDKDFSKITADITVNAVWTVIKPEKVTSLTAEAGKKSIDLSWEETEYAGYYLVFKILIQICNRSKARVNILVFLSEI